MIGSSAIRALAAVASALLAGALAGCATAPGPVEVTRFSRPALASAPRGALALLPAPGVDGGGIEYRAYAAAVSRELARLGYGAAPAAPTIAVVDVRREVSRPERARGPVSVGIGGSTGGWHSGVGLGVGFDLSGPPKPRVGTELAVTIRDRASGEALWEGRARFEVAANDPLADPQASAAKMAAALFRDFPGRSGETILVR